MRRDRVLRRSVRVHALGGRAATVIEAVRRAAGLYGAAPTCHLSLLARTGTFAPADLDHAVVRTRELVRVPAMRGSIYLLPRDLVPHALAVTPIQPVAHYAKTAGIAVRAYAPLADRIEKLLGEKPRTTAEVRAALGARAPIGFGLSFILGRMSREGRIVRAAARGGPRRQSFEYARMADWIDVPRDRPSRAEAMRALARPWLLANGPATAVDLAWWVGVTMKDAREALAAIGAQPTRVKGIEGDLYATEELLDDLADAPERDEEVQLLPLWDAYVMSHADRSRYLDEEDRPFVVDRSGNVTNVILYTGRVAGIWDVDGPTLLYAPFGPVPRRALMAAARRLAPLQTIDNVRVVDPAPLAEGGQNAFLAPLKARRKSISGL